MLSQVEVFGMNKTVGVDWIHHYVRSIIWILVGHQRMPSNLTTLRPKQNGSHVVDDIFKSYFLYKIFCNLIRIMLNSVPNGVTNNTLALAQIMAWHRTDGNPLYEPMVV